MLLIIRNLREIADHCRKGGNLPPERATWLAQSLESFLSHGCRSVDEALGLRFARGGVPWWIEEGMRSRDAALRNLAGRFCSGESITAQAATIRTLSMRFAAGNWRFDRTQRDMPPHYAGTPKEYLWLAFKSGAPMPLGARRLRSILSIRPWRVRKPIDGRDIEMVLRA